MNFPHDDTSSLVSFYGDPREAGFSTNLVVVSPPWQMTYEGRPVKGVRIHRKLAASLQAVFNDIAAQVGGDWSRLPAGAVKFSGSYNYRPVRGSSRLSCHAFGAAIDMDASANPMNRSHNRGTMSPIVIGAFKRQGWYWGGDFNSRQDPMHFQAANEGVVYTDDDFAADQTEYADLMPMAEDFMDAQSPPVMPVSYQPPSMLKSKTGWAAIGIGAGGVSEGLAQINNIAAQVNTAKWNAQQLGLIDVLFAAAHQPLFWAALVSIAAAVFIWFDHRKYKRLLEQMKASQK